MKTQIRHVETKLFKVPLAEVLVDAKHGIIAISNW